MLNVSKKLKIKHEDNEVITIKIFDFPQNFQSLLKYTREHIIKLNEGEEYEYTEKKKW